MVQVRDGPPMGFAAHVQGAGRVGAMLSCRANSIGETVPDLKPDTAAAEAYESVIVPEVFRPWAEVLVREARIQEGMRTLDVACATGAVARCAAHLCGPRGRSTGIDIDPAMIEVARAAARKEGL